MSRDGVGLSTEDPEQPEVLEVVTSPIAERIRKQIKPTYDSVISQIKAMEAADISADRIPTAPEIEDYAARVERQLLEWDKNGALKLFEEKKLTPRLLHVFNVFLSGIEWFRVFRELTKEQPDRDLQVEFLNAFHSHELNHKGGEAGLRLESQEPMSELRGNADEQRAAHERLQAAYPNMKICKPSMNSEVARIARLQEGAKGGILQGDGVFEATTGRLFDCHREIMYTSSHGLLAGFIEVGVVPGVCITDDGRAFIGKYKAGAVGDARLSVGEDFKPSSLGKKL